jgi:hypothetical protein
VGASALPPLTASHIVPVVEIPKRGAPLLGGGRGNALHLVDLKKQGFALRYYRRMAINKDKIPSSVTT